MPRLILARLVALLTACALVSLPGAPADAAEAWVVKAQRRLNALHCNAGRADGTVDAWTRSAVVRFQSRHGMAQTGRLTAPVRTRLHRADARPALQCSALRRRWAFTIQASAASAGAPGRHTSAHAVRRGTSRARKRRGMGNSLGAPGLLR